MLLRRLFLLTTLLASGLAAAQVYKWVDEDGVVHFSDQPRPGAEEVQIQRAPSPPSAQPTRGTAAQPPKQRQQHRQQRWRNNPAATRAFVSLVRLRT